MAQKHTAEMLKIRLGRLQSKDPVANQAIIKKLRRQIKNLEVKENN